MPMVLMVGKTATQASEAKASFPDTIGKDGRTFWMVSSTVVMAWPFVLGLVVAILGKVWLNSTIRAKTFNNLPLHTLHTLLLSHSLQLECS